MFNQKIVLVTGASRGIGRAIAQTFAEQGATVIGTGTQEKSAQAISDYLGSSGCGLMMDVNSQASVDAVLTEIKEKFGDVDILVNNAGVTRDNLFLRLKEEEWLDVIDTNLHSLYRVTKPVVRTMLKKRFGRIISIGSVVAASGNAGQTNYAATKAGMVGFSKSLAREVAPRGITVNVVAPGFIETDMTRALDEKQREALMSNIPAGCLGQPEDVAKTVVFLASDDAKYINGETIHVNGGMHMA